MNNSNSPSPSAERDASPILLRCERLFGDGFEYDFYLLNGEQSNDIWSKKQKGKRILYPFFLGPPRSACLEKSAWVVSGSTVYMIGGEHIREGYKINRLLRARPQLSNKVYSLDFSSLFSSSHQPIGKCLELYWKICPFMIKPRAGAYATCVGGKIFVFGNYYDRFTPWAESWNPSGGVEEPWKALNDINNEAPYLANGHAFLDDGLRLLVHTPASETLYLYDIKTDLWRLYTKKFGHFRCQTAFLDGIIYGCDDDEPGAIFGYDVSNPQGSPQRVEGYNSLEGVFPHGVVSVGNNKLCVIWSGYTGSSVTVSCLTFKVSKEIKAPGEIKLTASNFESPLFYGLPLATSVLDFHAL